jgi:uncharacterized integral membrane protein
MEGISSLDEDQLASQEGLCFKELFLFHVLRTYRFLIFEHEAPVTERLSTALTLQPTVRFAYP